jgi:hypothetical protein
MIHISIRTERSSSEFAQIKVYFDRCEQLLFIFIYFALRRYCVIVK